MSHDLLVVGLGRMNYEDALQLQRRLAHARIDGILENDVLLLLEHPPVVTLGRGSHLQHLTATSGQLTARGVTVHDIDRGGDVTFHGPGQLVGYPIYHLEEHRPDLHWYLRALEGALIRALDDFGIPGHRRDGLTGVWTQNRKIASIGIHVKKWVTWHGFALNVLTDLSYFDLIVPCGIQGVVMTSVQRELGERMPRDCWGRALDNVVLGFAEEFGQTPQAATLDQLLVST
jgi:lipoyl(octanoyl) transferase